MYNKKCVQMTFFLLFSAEPKLLIRTFRVMQRKTRCMERKGTHEEMNHRE